MGLMCDKETFNNQLLIFLSCTRVTIIFLRPLDISPKSYTLNQLWLKGQRTLGDWGVFWFRLIV